MLIYVSYNYSQCFACFLFLIDTFLFCFLLVVIVALRSPRALSPTDATPRENYETTFDLEGNVETVSTASVKEDNRSLGSVSENR